MRSRSTVHPAATAALVSLASLGLGLLVAVGQPAVAAPDLAAPDLAAPDLTAPARVASDRRTPDERAVDRVRVPRIDWKRCAGSQPGQQAQRQECAVIRVPLDYDRPRAATTPLSISRLVAARPGRRIGSLFVNPGGPGGSSSGFVTAAATELGPRVRARFDVVGVDPRGVAGSGRTTCRGAITTSRLDFPVGAAQVRRQIAAEDTLRRACARDASDLVAHASTADVARDMDLVRRALGDRQLTYYGISYGSYLGTSYAAMFPHRVRALVVDGVLDPIAWSSGNPTRPVTTPQTTRLRSGYGAYEAMTSALTACDRAGRRRCPIAPDALGTWTGVLQAARDGRLVVDGYAPTYQDVVGLALGALYSRDDIPFLMDLLAQFDAALDQAETRPRGQRRAEVATSDAYRRVVAARDALRERGLYAAPAAMAPVSNAPRRLQADVQFHAVLCSDARNPRSATRWEQASVVADRKSPWFGRLWTWSSSPCAKGGIGSSADAFRGPWRTSTSYPLLIVGNIHDPATPISGARRAHRLFRGSRLVTFETWAHGALGGSPCITGTMASYLVDRTLPARGTRCGQPGPLFP